MELNTETANLEKNKIFFIFKKYKKFIFLIFLGIIFTIGINYYYKISNEKRSNIISEKYIEARLLDAKKNKDELKLILEEIILSKDKFYSILALNLIIEQDLEKDKTKIVEYFKNLEDLNISTESRNLLILKKALYLMKNSDYLKGKEILQNLIDSDSNLKPIIEDIIN